jgi:hypothetical protein
LAAIGRHLRNHPEDVELLNMTDKQFAEHMERRGYLRRRSHCQKSIGRERWSLAM